MKLGTISTVVTHEQQIGRQIPSAAMLARQTGAHLDILALGVDELQMGYFYSGAEAVMQQQTLGLARERAERLTEDAKAAADKEGVLSSVNGVVSHIGALGDFVARTARYSDLVILSAPYADGSNANEEAVLEAALFSGQAPVLILPQAGLPQDFPRRVVIGWNDGSEALQAVRAALPLLRKAEGCHVAIIDPPERSAERAEPGRSLSTMLDRHGVKAEVALLPKTHARIANVLRDYARDVQADLIVAGAYGHSRFRQAILGGATRDLLSGLDLPVLLAH